MLGVVRAWGRTPALCRTQGKENTVNNTQYGKVRLRTHNAHAYIRVQTELDGCTCLRNFVHVYAPLFMFGLCRTCRRSQLQLCMQVITGV